MDGYKVAVSKMILAPNLPPRFEMNLVKYGKWQYVWNFKFRKCEFTKEDIWPFTKVYKSDCANNAGALFGGPVAHYDVYTTRGTFVTKRLKGELG